MTVMPGYASADTPHAKTVHLPSQGGRYGCSSVRTGDDKPRGGTTKYIAHPWSATPAATAPGTFPVSKLPTSVAPVPAFSLSHLPTSAQFISPLLHHITKGECALPYLSCPLAI